MLKINFVLKLTREIKTAVLVIVSIILFIWGYNFLKGKNLFENSNKLYVVFDSVEGLAPSSTVTIKGVPVGRVNSYTFLENKKVLVELSITSDYPISKSSIAQLKGASPLGGKEIVIIPNDSDVNLTSSGDYLQSSSKLGLTDALAKELEPLQEKVQRLLDNADVLFSSANDILDTQTKQNLKGSITELHQTLSEFRVVSKNLNEIVATNKTKLGSVITNFDKTSANLVVMSDSLAKANLGQTIKNLEKTLASVDKLMADMEKGKGTMGKLLKDETMYTNFSKASSELELLLQDLRLNPTRYVNVSLFGKKNKPYVAPVNDTIKK